MKNNPHKYWMKRRRYGWGWIPVTWQGWVVIIAQIGIVFVTAFQLPPKPAMPTAGQLFNFLATLVLAIGTILLVAWFTSPRPHWRWGKKDSDNPDEDF
jgi:hypothetical protein